MVVYIYNRSQNVSPSMQRASFALTPRRKLFRQTQLPRSQYASPNIPGRFELLVEAGIESRDAKRRITK